LAHEIKNPLTPIQLSAERIRHKCGPQLDDKTTAMLDRATNTIVEQVESLKSMVNTFSDYARPAQLTWQSLDINPLIHTVVELYRAERSATDSDIRKPVQFELHLDDSIPAIEADPSRIRQILNNLLANAKDAVRHSDKPRIHIYTACTDPEECHMVELEVRDNGPGIADDIIDRMFEPYVTGKEKGTGLGLAIVRKIIEEHNGYIEASILKDDNGEHCGTSIRVQLPVNQPTIPASPDEGEES
ncbi:MAG: GHKL domain-containing protein, partial [Proteobacteria bacterium]|nr:GHKL domain-containing protein [Pseudomonadota bacterium]